MNPISEVYNMDCVEYMKTLPDKFIDLAIVDPPFFKNVANGSFYGSGLTKNGVKRGNYSKIENWDNNIPTNEYYKELIRISKNQIVWGINYFTDFKDVPVGRLVWDKKNDNSTFSNCEIASCSLITSVKIFRYTWNGFIQESGMKKEIRIHQTQKPTSLYRFCLSNYAKKGDKIFDSHMGSQSSRLVSYDMGFDYYGTELDKLVFENGNKRFNEHKSQLNLF